MEIFIICSKRFYDRVIEIRAVLEDLGHNVTLPNCHANPGTEDEMRDAGKEVHASFKRRMFKQSEKITKRMDAVLVLNFDKDEQKNYVGGATFLEMYDAFRLDKKIFMWNDIPNCILTDEIEGFSPIVINGDIKLIK